MKNFEFVSAEKFPNDQYTKEAVTLCFEGKYRVVYLRKKMQNGGMFWTSVTASVTRGGGKKEYLTSFACDSNFLEKDIKEFLEMRKWENQAQKGGEDGSFPF